ncbi:MAG TPA: hypothetical protein VHE13_09200 [Opitutus sp.]|nr:hypothetical protein [Opitutus sp.]
MRPLALLVSVTALALSARADEPAAPPEPATPPALAAKSSSSPPATPAADAAGPATPAATAESLAEPKHQATVAEIRARLLEHLRKKTDENRPAHAKDAKEEKPAKADAKAAPPATAGAKPAEPAHVLPKYEIKQMPITELDLKLAKQNREIAQEKKNTEATPLDETLNGKKVSHFLSFLGGQSSDQRASVASERVYIMEQEKDLIEAIADAQTKEDKAELEKALADLRKTRRELEQSLR